MQVLRYLLLSLVALVLSLSLAAPVAAGPYEDAAAAYDRGDYTIALRLYRPPADQGDDKAQFNLGAFYEHGHGVPQDYAEVAKWYRRAADQGNAKAQFNLGVMYTNGQGLPQDYAEAAKWFRLAADQGVAKAQFNLAVMYHNGLGVPQDYAMAAVFARKTADQGNAEAQGNLGTLYAGGLSVPQDYVHPYIWFNLAAAHFPATDTEDRDKAVKYRDEVAALMTPGQIAEAERLAHEWKPNSPQ